MFWHNRSLSNFPTGEGKKYLKVTYNIQGKFSPFCRWRDVTRILHIEKHLWQ